MSSGITGIKYPQKAAMKINATVSHTQIYKLDANYITIKTRTIFFRLSCPCDLAHLITVGVISAQKKMLRLLTAWEENMPMMEKAIENLEFSVSELSVWREKDNMVSHLLFYLLKKKHHTSSTI